MPQLTLQEFETMYELLDYPTPQGIHPAEARWRQFARMLKNRYAPENIILDYLIATDDPNQLGEYFRNHVAFTNEGFGCYSNFNLTPGFTEITKSNDTNLHTELSVLLTCKSWRGEFQDKIATYSNGSVDVAWYWDGDGVLLFRVRDRQRHNGKPLILIHPDCKNDYEWEFAE